MRDRSLFGGRTRAIIVALAIVSLVATLGAMVFGRQLSPTPAQPRDSYGRGPLGHRAFFETLEELGIHAARWTHPGWTDVSAPLFFIEPSTTELWLEGENVHALGDVVRDRITADRVTVIVLPKWALRADDTTEHERYEDLVAVVDTLPIHLDVLPDMSDAGDAWRTIDAMEADGTARSLELRAPQRIEGGEPILFDDRGSFVVSDDKHLLFVVSDPDLLHSFNMQRADHAAFWRDFVRETLHSDAIVIDEVFHGSMDTRSLAELFATWPGVLALVHCGLLVLVLLAMGRKRFGPPEPVPEALGRGPREVIDVAASVLASGTRVPTLALRYVEDLVADLHRRLGLGEAKSADERARLVDGAAERRKLAPRAIELLSRARSLEHSRRAGEALALARDASFFRARLLSGRVPKEKSP